MSGCFSQTDREDQIREIELFNYLANLAIEEEEMSEIVEISEKEAELFLSVIGNMPAHWDEKNDTLDSMVSDEKEYDALMKMYDRIHNIVNGE